MRFPALFPGRSADLRQSGAGNVPRRDITDVLPLLQSHTTSKRASAQTADSHLCANGVHRTLLPASRCQRAQVLGAAVRDSSPDSRLDHSRTNNPSRAVHSIVIAWHLHKERLHRESPTPRVWNREIIGQYRLDPTRHRAQ